MITIVVTLITALSTTVPGIITNYLNNKNLVKLKKLEIYENDKKQIVSSFINSATSCLNLENKNEDIYIELIKYSNNLFFYFPKYIEDIRDFIKYIDLYFEDKNAKQTVIEKLSNIIELLSKSTTEIQ